MKLSSKLGAYALQLLFRVLPSTPKELMFSGADIIPTAIWVPTRHGNVRCLVYRKRRPIDAVGSLPVYVNIHGGAFIVRAPEQFIASTTDAIVVSIDYDAAPRASYPVAEYEVYDVVEWIHRNDRQLGWNSSRLAVGGFSAGAKLAINVCQQARDSGSFMPIASIACYPALDMTLASTSRVSSIEKPAVAPWLINLMYNTYFVEVAKRSDPLASPGLDNNVAAYPPVLLLVGAWIHLRLRLSDLQKISSHPKFASPCTVSLTAITALPTTSP